MKKWSIWSTKLSLGVLGQLCINKKIQPNDKDKGSVSVFYVNHGDKEDDDDER